MAAKPPGPKVVCVNRKARYDFDVLDRFEAGVSLQGSEVKALREGKGNLVDAFVTLRDGRPTLLDFEISAYSHDRSGSARPRRPRALLMHASEIRKLITRTREKGLTLIPLQVYFKGPWAKVEVGLCRGRRKHDKRELLKAKAEQRELDGMRRRRR